MRPFKNELYKSKSPYLRQHADNPVNWQEWNESTLELAKSLDRPILVSIGYSACHWCHVMAHESFENESIAQFLNENYISIKIDREERPDVDQIYMDALQNMGISGGWPLNIFTMPDGKPFYGGTYFPSHAFLHILKQITEAYNQHRSKLLDSANSFYKSLEEDKVTRYLKRTAAPVSISILEESLKKLDSKYDTTWGGIDKAPKFPMPALWQFILISGTLISNSQSIRQGISTVKKICQGGIYDHVGGGIARYSVDAQWHVPHFEKMLYDNAQFLSLLATAYTAAPNDEFLEKIYGILSWLKNEMKDSSGGYYSALDADSEGIEGKFYTWKKEELLKHNVLDILLDYYDVREDGNWEETNVLRELLTPIEFCTEKQLVLEDFNELRKNTLKKLLRERNKRTRPGTDSKIILGWNALLLTGLIDVYRVTGSEDLLEDIHSLFRFLSQKLNNKPYAVHVDTIDIEAFCDDYAYTIKSMLDYYELTGDIQALKQSKGFADYVIHNFFDESQGYFFYKSKKAEKILPSKIDLFDNVTPSPNSVMTLNLKLLGEIYENELFKDLADRMMNKLVPLLPLDPEFLGYWGFAACHFYSSLPILVIVGPDHFTYSLEIKKQILQPIIILQSPTETAELEHLSGKKLIQEKTTLYVCINQTCKLPVTSPSEAILQLKEYFRFDPKV